MNISQSILLFIAAVIVGIVIGVDASRTVIQKDCDAFGRFRFDKTVFVCTEHSQQ